MTNKLKIILIILISFFAILLFCTNAYSQNDFYSQSFKLKDLSDSYDERGFLKNSNVSIDGNLLISEFNGNVMYSYPISNTKINGSNINVTLNYSGSVPFTSFSFFEHSVASWRSINKNRSAWILGVNGFAVQVFGGASFFTNKPHVNGNEIKECYNNYQFCQLEPWYSKEYHNDNDVNWVIEGYDYCNTMRNPFPLTEQTRGYQDVIKILKSDGSILELRNVSVRDPNASVDAWDDEEFFTGIYYESSPDSKAFAKVEFITDCYNIEKPTNNLCMNFDGSNYNYNRSPFWSRLVHYYPGDGFEYIFREYIIPFGSHVLFALDPTGAWRYANCQLYLTYDYSSNNPYYGYHFNMNVSSYIGKKLPLGFSIGGNWAHPTIFYLEEIHNEFHKVADFTYSRHHSCEQQNNEGIHDDTRGRALLKGFLNHKINYSNDYATIEAPNHTYTLYFGLRKISGWDATVENQTLPNDFLYSRFDDYSSAIRYLTRPDNSSCYYSWIDYITKIQEQENSNQVSSDAKIIEFEYDNYTRILHGECTSEDNCHYFPKISITNGANLTMNDYRLTTVINPDYKQIIEYIEPPSNQIELSSIQQGVNGGDYFYKLNNVAGIVDKKDKNDLHLSRSEYSFLQYDRQTIMDLPLFPQDYEKCFARCTLKVYDKINNNKLTETQTWYESFKLEPPHDLGPNYRNTTPYLYKTNLLKKVEIAEGITKTTWSTVEKNLTATNDRNQLCNLSLIFLPQYIKQDIKFKDDLQNDVEIVKTLVSFNYELSQLHNSVKIRDYSINDADYKVYDAFGFEVLKQTQNIWNPIDINTGNPYFITSVFKSNPRKLLFTENEYTNLPLSTSGTLNISDNIFNYEETLKEYNRLFYEGAQPDSRVLGKTLEDVLCLVEKYSQVNLTTKTFPPVFGVQTSEKLFFNNGTNDILLQGNRRVIDETPIQSGSIDFKYGNDIEKYLISKNNLSEILTDELDYTSGFKYGGLLKSNTKPNSSQTFYFYDYNDAQTGGYWSIPNDPTDNVCNMLYSPSGIIRTNMENNDNSNNLFYSRLNQGLYQYYSNQPYITKYKVRKYSNNGSVETSIYIPNLFDYDANGNIRKSLDPNGWLNSFSYDIYSRNKQINLPFDFISPSSINGSIPSPEKIVISNSGITRHTYDKEAVQCTTCTTNNNVEKCRWDALGEIHVDEVYDNANLFSANQPDYYPFIFPCTNPLDLGEYCETITRIWQIEERTLPKWYGQIKLTKPSNLSNITNISSAFFKIYLTSIKGQDVSLTVSFPNLSFSKYYLFNASSGSQNNPSDGFLTIDLSSKLNEITNILNNDGSIKVELKLFSIDHVKIEFANFGSNKLPSLILEGSFNWNNQNKYTIDNFTKYDYTLKHDFNFQNLESHRLQKIDDANHTYNSYTNPFRRELDFDFTFDANYKVKSFKRNNGASDEFEYFGNRLIKSSKDKLNQTALYQYDALGRITQIQYPDQAQVNSEYKIGRPFNEFNLIDEDYFGYCYKKTRIDNKGTKTSQFYDAFDRLRMEINDEGGLNKTIKYQYDLLGRLTHVINPKGQFIRYWYDNFGRIKYKYQPDMGVLSYAYDNSGNLRFSQTEEQAIDKRVTYYEYDDLNRILAFGEAKISSIIEPITLDPIPNNLNNDELSLNRLTDVLDCNSLHTAPETSIFTDNKTLWLPPQPQPYEYTQMNWIWPNTNCIPLVYKSANKILGIDAKPQPPLIMSQIKPQDDPGFIAVAENSFENLNLFPQSMRIISYYDELPPIEGIVWSYMPPADKWNDLAPVLENGNRKLRNQKGKVAAIAYREHGGQPFNFMTFSYDERGRVEAICRFTQNIGFDAVYYKYNSKNDLISVINADPTRVYKAWYGYDSDDRLENIWSSVPQITGLYGNPNYPKSPQQPDGWAPEEPSFEKLANITKPINPDVTYNYTVRDQVSSSKYFILYPNDYIQTDYQYSLPRKWMNEILSVRNTDQIFSENLSYDNNKLGLITLQTSQQTTFDPILEHFYTYDNLLQLDQWQYAVELIMLTENYDYDLLGNILQTEINYLGDINQYFISNGYNDNSGPNRLTNVLNGDRTGAGSSVFTYNKNGSLSQTERIKNLSMTVPMVWENRKENFYYDIRGLTDRYSFTKQYSEWFTEDCWPDLPEDKKTEWRYWYNPFGEREQKRMHYSPAGDKNGAVQPWVYYLLGNNNEQYVVYNGFQLSDPFYWIGPNEVCTSYITPPASKTFLYPTEYNIYGSNSSIPVSYVVDANGAWQKNFKIFDHLGSIRSIVRTDGTIVGKYDYEPFGAKLDISDGLDRMSFISKEKDNESMLGNFGVRMYEDCIGRFTTPEPLWEKYYGWSPYVYSTNNPISLKDDNGLWVWIANSESGSPKLKSYSRNFSYIPSSDFGKEYFQKRLNRNYSIWNNPNSGHYAPAIANYLKSNDIFIGISDYGEKGNFGIWDKNTNFTLIYQEVFDNKSVFDEFGITNADAATLLHEIVHMRGGNEFDSWSANFAANYISLNVFLTNFREWKRDLPSEFDQYFDENDNLIESKKEEFEQKLREYGEQLLQE